MDPREVALKERNQRVLDNSVIYIKRKRRIKNFFRTSVSVESLDGIFKDVHVIDQAIAEIELLPIRPDHDADLVFCQKICDALFLKLAAHFADSDIKITTSESSGSAITVHYRSSKPSLSIKI